MSISPAEATASLSEIERVVNRVKLSATYRHASHLLILWGVLVMLGDAGSYIRPRSAAMIWLAVNATGLAAMAVMALRSRSQERRKIDLRFIWVLLLFFGFGLLWSLVLGKFGPRELSAFWTTLFMLGYAIAGIWFGRGFIAVSLVITALTVAGYYWAGAAFDLYMALVNGGGLIFCGLLMRRA